MTASWFARAATAALVLAGGCMRIYPDPELPDIVVQWGETCGDDGVTVRVEAVAADGTRVAQDFACALGEGRVEDLDRVKHTITATLLDGEETVLGRSMPSSIDLFDGLSRRVYAYDFARDLGFLRVAWTFTGGDTCASLGAETLMVELTGGEMDNSTGGPCADGHFDFLPAVQPGTYTVRLRAARFSDFMAVAVSEPRPDVVVPDRGAVVDLGTIELTRCAPSCPAPTPSPPPPE